MKQWALVDWKGNVIIRRFFPFRVEIPGRESGKPNLYFNVHCDPRGIDGSSGLVTAHNHPWHALAIILRGGYTELRAENSKIRKALSAYFISHREKHAVVETLPGTWSIFAHWFKRADWEFKLQPCEKLCDKCETVCERTVTAYEITDITNTDQRSRHSQQWVEVTGDFESRMQRRRSAINKLGEGVQEVDPVTYFRGIKK